MIKIFDLILFNGLGLLLLVFGLITIVNPEIFSKLYGIELPTSDAVAAIRAIIGGSEIAIGSMLLFRKKLGFTDRSLCAIGALIFMGIVAARTYHAIEYPNLSSRFVREFGAEFFILIILYARLKIGFSNKVDS